VAVEAALAHPDRVSALAVVCSALDWTEAPAELREAMDEADGIGEGGDVDRAVELELRIWVDGQGRREPVDPALREAVRAMNRLAWEHGLAAGGDSVQLDPPASGRLEEIAAPTLVITGEHDVPFMTESCRSIAAVVPGARFELMTGVAHVPPLERPDAFAALLTDFLTEVER
jgi:pimeloyl-ACP methyl ester carboxylesterase